MGISFSVHPFESYLSIFLCVSLLLVFLQSMTMPNFSADKYPVGISVERQPYLHFIVRTVMLDSITVRIFLEIFILYPDLRDFQGYKMTKETLQLVAVHHRESR